MLGLEKWRGGRDCHRKLAYMLGIERQGDCHRKLAYMLGIDYDRYTLLFSDH